MRRLKDGLYAVLVRKGGPLLVRHAHDAEVRRDFDDETALAGADLLAELPDVDPILEAVWTSLGAGLEDPRWSDEEREILRRLRRHASVQKIARGLSHTALVPESALALALRLRRHLSPGDRVLALGGYSLAGVAVAELGLDVTRVDDDGSVLRNLDEAHRGRYAFVLVDTLPYEGLQAGALARAQAMLSPGGRLVGFAHSMQRPIFRELFSVAGLSVVEPLFEIAARVHAGLTLEPFLWDAWVLAPRDEHADPTLSEGAPLDEAKGLDPSERVQGAIDVIGFAPGGLTPEGMDRAVELLLAAPPTRILDHYAADEDGAAGRERVLRRTLVFEPGGYLLLAAYPERGEVAVDVLPWSPRVLFAAIAALRLASGALSLEVLRR